MSKGMNERASEGGEKFLEGRRAGVEGTHGQPRKGVAEKTVIGHGDQRNSGSLDPDLGRAVGSMYSRALSSSPDPSKMGDQAMFDR